MPPELEFGAAPLLIREFTDRYEAVVAGVGLAQRTLALIETNSKRARYLSGGLVGAAVGSAVTRKADGAVRGAGLGALAALLVDAYLERHARGGGYLREDSTSQVSARFENYRTQVTRSREDLRPPFPLGSRELVPQCRDLEATARLVIRTGLIGLDPAAAARLGRIACRIRGAQQGGSIVLTGFRICKPDAGTDSEGLPTLPMQNELVDRRKNPSGDPLCVLPRTSWQKNRKFVATQAGPGIVRTQVCFQKMPDAPERLVASSVPTCVVDLFESIQINEQQSVGLTPLRAGLRHRQ